MTLHFGLAIMRMVDITYHDKNRKNSLFSCAYVGVGMVEVVNNSEFGLGHVELVTISSQQMNIYH